MGYAALGFRGEVALGWGLIHSQFLQVEIHKFTTKKDLVAHLQQQPASDEFVRSCTGNPWLLSLGKLCKAFRDKWQLIVKMHGEHFQGFENINTVRLCYFISFLNGVGSMTIPGPKRWWEGSGFVKSPCFPQGVSVTDMDTRHVPLKIDMLQIL